MRPHFAYLGDAVYARVLPHDRGIELTTKNGVETTNRIVLEPEVLIALDEFLERVYGAEARK